MVQIEEQGGDEEGEVVDANENKEEEDGWLGG